MISSREVDFGATDIPISADEAKRLGLMQFPTMVGGLVPTINVKGIASKKLKLTGPVLADIFAARITRWNDPKIASLNPVLNLPSQDIVRVVRRDSSGSTESFTKYLSGVSPSWARVIGSGKIVRWPGTVQSANGTDGVATLVHETPGAIGYVSYDRVMHDKLAIALLQNRSGFYVEPSEYAFRVTIKASDLGRKGDESASLIDLSGQDVWPITDATFILVDTKPKSSEGASRVLSFFYWAFLKGDDVVAGTGFAPLPSELQARIVRRLSEVQPGDGRPLELIFMPQLEPQLAELFLPSRLLQRAPQRTS